MEQLNAISEEIASIGRKLEDLYKLPSIAESVESSAVVKELLEHVDALGMSVDRVCRDHIVAVKTLKHMTNPACWSKRWSLKDNGYIHVFTPPSGMVVKELGSDIVNAVGDSVMRDTKHADAGLG